MALRHRHTAQGRPDADAAVARSNPRCPGDEHCPERAPHHFACYFRAATDIAMGDMAGLVRHGADDFQRRIGPHDQAGVDEHPVAGGDERVYGTVPHQYDADRAGIEAGGAVKGRGELAQQSFGFGVADDDNAFAGSAFLRPSRRKRKEQGAYDQG